MSLRDEAIGETCPLVRVPVDEPPPDMEENGHRLLVAADGLWLEVKRPWLWYRGRIGESAWQTPYGILTEKLELHFHGGRLGMALKYFVTKAREELPNEHAAWVAMNPRNPFGDLDVVPVDVIRASPSRIKYARPNETSQCLPFIDLHTHGRSDAWFSPETDDVDDSLETKLAIVFGRVNEHAPQIKARLCLSGVFIDVTDMVVKACLG